MTVHQVMQSKWTLAGLVAAIVSLPNLGKGLGAVAYLVNTPKVAYAAQSQAEDTASEFQQYLAAQRAYTEALNDYTRQMQERQAPSVIERYWDAEAQRYYCDDGTTLWWATADGTC